MTMTRWTGWLALLLASQTEHAAGVIVEASDVTNVVVTSDSWDLNGCGGGGCDPRLTRDGDDNTVPDSRWSCEPSIAAPFNDNGGSCSISFEFDQYFDIDHIMLYIHESDTEEIAIPFTVRFEDYLTTPGLALGVGQRINFSGNLDEITIDFDVTMGQYINLSEVEIYLDVEDPEDFVVEPLELYEVNAKTVTTVVATATYWDLDVDAGCGEAGCLPGLASDGQDNTVTASRWSCNVESWYDPDRYFYDDDETRCKLILTLDGSYTISYIVLYLPESDDATEEGQSFVVHYGSERIPVQTTPGTELGEGQVFNLPRPLESQIEITPLNATAGQTISISEVEIFVEVTDKNVPVSAAPAWTDVPAESLTTVTASASSSVGGFTPDATTDGDDNTVAASRWSCEGTEDEDFCELKFEFNDEYTVSHLDLYMHQSADASKEPVSLAICSCYYSDWSGDVECNCGSSVSLAVNDLAVGTYVTKPGTPLGEPERINVVHPLTSAIGIRCDNLTAIGGTLSISEVEIHLLVPDATPTPSPFASPAPTPGPTYVFSRLYDDDDFDFGFDDDLLDNLLDDDGARAGTRIPMGGLLCCAFATAVVLAIGGSSWSL